MGSKASKKAPQKTQNLYPNQSEDKIQPNQTPFPNNNNKAPGNLPGINKNPQNGPQQSNNNRGGSISKPGQPSHQHHHHHHHRPHHHNEEIAHVELEPVAHSKYFPPPNVHPITMFELNEENMRMYQPRCCGSTSMRPFAPQHNFGTNRYPHPCAPIPGIRLAPSEFPAQILPPPLPPQPPLSPTLSRSPSSSSVVYPFAPNNNPLLPHNLNGPFQQKNHPDLPFNPPARETSKKPAKKKCFLFDNSKKDEAKNANDKTLQRMYNIDENEMKQLKKIFNEHCGTDQNLNFQEFVKLFGVMNPSMRGPHFVQAAEQAFKASDTNQNGRLNFQEFLVAYVLTKPQRNSIAYPNQFRDMPNKFMEPSNMEMFSPLINDPCIMPCDALVPYNPCPFKPFDLRLLSPVPCEPPRRQKCIPSFGADVLVPYNPCQPHEATYLPLVPYEPRRPKCMQSFGRDVIVPYDPFHYPPVPPRRHRNKRHRKCMAPPPGEIISNHAPRHHQYVEYL